MTYSQIEVRERALLKLALWPLWPSDRRECAAIIALLHTQGYELRGYKRKLEQLLRYVNRAIAAAEALEGNADAAQTKT